MDIEQDTIAELIAFANDSGDVELLSVQFPTAFTFSVEEFESVEAPLHTSQMLVGRNFDTDEELTLHRKDGWRSKLPRGLRLA